MKLFKKIIGFIIILNILPFMGMWFTDSFLDNKTDGYQLGWIYNCLIIIIMLIIIGIVKGFKFLFSIK